MNIKSANTTSLSGIVLRDTSATAPQLVNVVVFSEQLLLDERLLVSVTPRQQSSVASSAAPSDAVSLRALVLTTLVVVVLQLLF